MENVRDEQTYRTLLSVVRFASFLRSVGGFSFTIAEASGDQIGSLRRSGDVPRVWRQVCDYRPFARANVEAFGHDAV